MINLLHVSPVGMKAAGTEQMIHLLCRHLDRSRISNFLWSPYGGGPTLDVMQAESVLADVLLSSDPVEFTEFVNRHGIRLAVVHSGGLNALYVQPLFGALREVPGLGIIEVMHRPRPSWGAAFGIDRIVVVSPHITALQPPDYRGRVVVIPNGIELDLFVPSPESRAAGRARWGIPPQAATVGFLGRMAEEKGPQDILEAARTICETAGEVWFLFGGDGALRTTLEQRAAVLGLPNVRFPGHVSAAERAAFYAATDVLLFPSRHNDALPMVLIEASAMGLPVVAYRVDAVLDFFTAAVQRNYLVETQDIRGLAKTTAALLKDGAARANLGEHNRAHAQRYAIQNTAARYVALFEEVVVARPAAPPAGTTPQLFRYMANIAMVHGERAKAEARFQQAYASAPALAGVIQEDVQRFIAFVNQLQNTRQK